VTPKTSKAKARIAPVLVFSQLKEGSVRENIVLKDRGFVNRHTP
jgi:hypothetical protein